jgi:hypothetical protein
LHTAVSDILFCCQTAVQFPPQKTAGCWQQISCTKLHFFQTFSIVLKQEDENVLIDTNHLNAALRGTFWACGGIDLETKSNIS